MLAPGAGIQVLELREKPMTAALIWNISWKPPSKTQQETGVWAPSCWQLKRETFLSGKKNTWTGGTNHGWKFKEIHIVQRIILKKWLKVNWKINWMIHPVPKQQDLSIGQHDNILPQAVYNSWHWNFSNNIRSIGSKSIILSMGPWVTPLNQHLHTSWQNVMSFLQEPKEKVPNCLKPNKWTTTN